MKLIIDIPKEAKQAFDKAESNNLKGGYYDHGGVIGKAIQNGTPLPKGHGRLIDADALYEDLIFPTEQFSKAFKEILDDAPTIIEADYARYER